MSKKKKGKEDLIQGLIENKLVQLLGIIILVYTLLGLFGFNLTGLNIIFQPLIITVLVTWAAVSFANYLNKKIKNLKKILKDIKAIKSIRTEINKIRKQQQIDKKRIENLLYKYDLRVKKVEGIVPHRIRVFDRGSSVRKWGKFR